MKSYLPGIDSRYAITLLVVMAFFLCASSSLVQAKSPVPTEKPRVEYSRDADDLIVSYVLNVGEIADIDGGPRLQIYGDGFAYVHYPVYMTRAGDYGVQLSEREMRTLLESLTDDGVIEFDPAGTRDALSEIDTSRRENEGVMHFVSDPSVSVIELNLVSYSPAGSPALQQANLSKTIHWSGLESDGRLYPDHLPIQKLASAERSLRTIMERNDLIDLDAQTLRAKSVPGQD